jgi:hypothetical protein
MLEHYITIRRWNDTHGSVDVSSVERRDLVPSIQWHIIIICILASLVGRYNVQCCSEMTSQESLFASENALARCNSGDGVQFAQHQVRFMVRE